MFGLKSKSLKSHLSETKKIKVHGMRFIIKRINVLDHAAGARVMGAVYDTYQLGNAKQPDIAVAKIKSHFVDVFMAGIVSPKLCRKQKDGGILAENLLTDWELAQELYSEIMLFTYGKKNFKRLTSQKTDSLKLMQ